MQAEVDVESTLHHIAERLERQFHMPMDEIERLVHFEYDELAASSRVTQHLPTLTERTVRQMLKASLA